MAQSKRRLARRPVLVRKVGTLRCWVAQLIEWSLAGSKLVGFPSHGGLTVGTSVEILEGLDVDSFENLAPVLSQPDLAKFELAVERLRYKLGLRRSTGKVVRVEPRRRHFAIRFDEVSDASRAYPKTHSQNPSLRASFTYKDSVGILSVRGNLTPGAAIDLAKDVVNDVHQCIVIVDLSAVRGMNRTALDKFRTRLRSQLDQQDLAYALAVVSPEEWVRNLLEQMQTYPTLKQAEEAVWAGLPADSESGAEEEPAERGPNEPSASSTQSGTK